MHTSDCSKPREEDPVETQEGVFLEPIALEISHHLASGSHPAQAAAVLNQLIKSNLPGVSVKTVIALARITYDMASDSKSWEYAAELWNLVMAEGPDNEALLKLSHCLAELGK